MRDAAGVAPSRGPAPGHAPSRCPLSVLLTVRDEEIELPLALASVEAWADETVVVVDPRTTDRTREVALACGVRVLEHAFESSAAQCNWGLTQCRHGWVLVLDADERVTPGLRSAITTVIAAPRHQAYSLDRSNYAFGSRLRFGDWGRDRIIRLLDRASARFEERAVHGAVRATSVGHLEAELEHHTLRSLGQYLPKVADYARLGAAQALAAGTSVTLPGAFGRASWRLVRGLVLRLGILDCAPGLIVAALNAWGSFLKWALVWEASHRFPSEGSR